MKTGPFIYLAALLLALACTSCTVIHTDRNKGTATLATLGGDLQGYAATADGAAAESITNSASFKEFSGAIKAGVYASAAKAIFSTAGKAWTSVSKSRQLTERTGITEKGLTDRAGIAADVEKARISAGPALP